MINLPLHSRRKDDETGNPLFSSMLSIMNTAEVDAKPCDYIGFISSHVLLSANLPRVLSFFASQSISDGNVAVFPPSQL